MYRKLLPLLLILCLLAGCAQPAITQEPTRYKATFLTLFDTVTTIIGFSESQESFTELSQQIHDELLQYHQLFDIYNDYEGLNNLKTVNDNAGIGPVTVDQRIIDLLMDCREYYDLTGGRVNVAMGSVLYEWHQARNEGINDPSNARLPERKVLEEAAKHCSFDTIVIDEAASTVFIADPDQRLDVGAVAKGWSVERVAQTAPAGLLLSVGGNIRGTGAQPDGTRWVVGVQDPDGGDQYLHTLYLTDTSVVTSGDYQRYYIVDGQIYHHIIDPDTLTSANYWRSVTVLCENSGLADALSTALFLLPLAEGLALLEYSGAEAMWVAADGTFQYSPGFADHIRT